jgi:cytochrome c
MNTLFRAACVAVLLGLAVPPSFAGAAEPVDPRRFEKEILVAKARDAIQMEVLPGGDVLFIEYAGGVQRWDARTGVVSKLGHVPTHARGEVGLLGMAVARDFETSGHLYVLFCPLAKQGTMRVSRFTVTDGKMPADSEVELLSWPYDTEHVFHMGGAMWMDGKGHLYIGTGDNCHHDPGLPQDTRPDRKNWDAFRSAANSRDLRGKVLRIHPLPAGGYAIPQSNLFADGRDGRPEVFAMGVRNPFRLSVDDKTGTLYFGDVGPNLPPALGVTPHGYDEINATRTGGNFGWPLFVGPNEALPLYDFAAKKPGQRYDPDSPENLSPRNTGIRKLPPAQPALIWYSSLPSPQFPTLGSGGRTILAGPVYRYDAANPSAFKLPEALDGRLFIYEWMRNWIQTVKLGTAGPEIEPFLPTWALRRPIDLKIGPDGALYMIEYGDLWWENQDSRITRVVYRRGNRPPVARMTSSETAGRPPLALTFDASASTDADGDTLKYGWTLAGQEQTEAGATFAHTFAQPGIYEVGVTITDASGAKSSAKETIYVGNGRPTVRFESPAHGSFFDWGSEIDYQVAVAETDGDSVQANQVSVQGQFRGRHFATEGALTQRDPGLELMRASTCFACHMADTPSAGPSYQAVALRYKDDPAAAERLAQKILSGGSGTWGQLPMPPHPQHTLDQSRRMVAWVLALKDDPSGPPMSGPGGTYVAPPRPADDALVNEGVITLTAAYTDDGKQGAMPRLRGEASIVLHSRRKKAALYDENHGIAVIEHAYGEKSIVGYFKDGSYLLWRDLNLTGVSRLTVRAGSFDAKGGTLELRRDSPSGALLARIDVPTIGAGDGNTFRSLPVRLVNAAGLANLCVVARCADPNTVLGLNWIEFHPPTPGSP